MGMAASQARYLALVARKSNCEYEGQQINQARTVLSNQTANLFNQMLGLSVPIPPSTQDFTTTQYSFTDGINKITMDDWNQLATPEEDYNYVVSYHYNADVYTGSQKKLNDPQVQFTGSLPGVDYTSQVKSIQAALENIEKCQKEYDDKFSVYKNKLAEASKMATYQNNGLKVGIVNHSFSEDGKTVTINIPKKASDGATIYKDASSNRYYYNSSDGKYYSRGAGVPGALPAGVTVTKLGDEPGDDAVQYYRGSDDNLYSSADDGATYALITETEYTGATSDLLLDTNDTEYTQASKLNDADPELRDAKVAIANALTNLQKYGAIDDKYTLDDVYYDVTSGTMVFRSDIEKLMSSSGSGTATILPSYYAIEPSGAGRTEDDKYISVATMAEQINAAKIEADTVKAQLELAQATFETMSIPGYVGNCKLTPLSSLTNIQMAEIAQIIKDMDAQDVNTNFKRCFDSLDGTYTVDNYSGGIYSFKLNGITYYTTFYDLADTVTSGEGINHIDNQDKLPYYRADYVSTKIEAQEKALLETDGHGRFTSIRIGDDTVTYALNMETITDDRAYQDAMNRYYYENAKYDKMVQDINAKTSLIHQEDQQLELRLKQLDTEQNALSNEIDAVSKVVKDNVEKSFKTFGG